MALMREIRPILERNFQLWMDMQAETGPVASTSSAPPSQPVSGRSTPKLDDLPHALKAG